ncbi:MAG: beta-glucosidase-like glycosyl hydrolase [Haloplasmataceae bacterium]|jgi:beta-glucosidase|nr:beta-glucosidase-like glycosyl hydrolase [Haloplasmataceae bacterium]
MVKKILSICFLLVVTLSLFACRTSSTNSTTTNSTQASTSGTTSNSTTATTTGDEVVLRECLGLQPTLNDPLTVNSEIQALVEVKVDSMTLAEKAGQMVQAERKTITPQEVTQYNVGSILSGGGSTPAGNTPEAWLNMYNSFQQAALDSSSGIPIIYGVDAVHGHNNVYGATVFPHNIGLGAANDPELMYKIGETTAEEIAITGLDWNFSPAVSVVQDIRWGRSYESFGECADLHVSLVQEYVQGLQQHNIAATAKHFIGDGGTKWNPSNYRDSNWAFTNPYAFMLDQGNTIITEEELREIHLPGYIEAINAGVDTVMISYSSFNGQKMHSHNLIQTLLKDELGFKGMVVGDYEATHQLPGDFNAQVVASVNAGLDMLMEPDHWKDSITAIINGVNSNKISIDRVNDAVSRILTVKYINGIMDHPIKELDTAYFNSDEHKEIAREAARKSQVLLKNENDILPLAKDANILLLGPGADHVGLQNGGWTIGWQGTMDKNVSKGTSILEGIENVLNNNNGNVYTSVADKDNAEVVVVVLAERPYAEGIGDNGSLALNSPTSLPENITALNQAKSTGLPIVVILLSGRPLIVTSEIKSWDAFIASWLPGSEGGAGIADVLFGDYNFTGKLPVTWPKTNQNASVTINKEDYNSLFYLFPYGYGLEY